MDDTSPNPLLDSLKLAAAAAPATREKTVTIDGKTYKLSDLSEASRQHLRNIRLAEQEALRLQALTGMVQTARNSYAQLLLAELQKTNPPQAGEKAGENAGETPE